MTGSVFLGQQDARRRAICLRDNPELHVELCSIRTQQATAILDRLLVGFGILVRCSVGDRMDAARALMIPLGFATAVIGAMVLTRSLLAVFFLFIYAVTALILILAYQGFANPAALPFGTLLILCLPMARSSRRGIGK